MVDKCTLLVGRVDGAERAALDLRDIRHILRFPRGLALASGVPPQLRGFHDLTQRLSDKLSEERTRLFVSMGVDYTIAKRMEGRHGADLPGLGGQQGPRLSCYE